MNMMSLAMLDAKQMDIDKAYQDEDWLKVKIETLQVLNYAVVVFLNKFQDRISSIILDEEHFDFNEQYLMSSKHHEDLLQWMNRLAHLKTPMDDAEFGKLKIDFENWFYKIGGKNIKFEYRDHYLLTPKEAADMLNVSNVTVHKYLKNGLECVDTRSHRKIPKHAVLLWKDPVYCILMQKIYHENKMRNQSPEERLNDIWKELLDYQLKYGLTYGVDTLEKARKLAESEEMDISEYYQWEALIEEFEELKKKLKGN